MIKLTAHAYTFKNKKGSSNLKYLLVNSFVLIHLHKNKTVMGKQQSKRINLKKLFTTCDR